VGLWPPYRRYRPRGRRRGAGQPPSAWLLTTCYFSRRVRTRSAAVRARPLAAPWARPARRPRPWGSPCRRSLKAPRGRVAGAAAAPPPRTAPRGACAKEYFSDAAAAAPWPLPIAPAPPQPPACFRSVRVRVRVRVREGSSEVAPPQPPACFRPVDRQGAAGHTA
jgi:hypothetical protein